MATTQQVKFKSGNFNIATLHSVSSTETITVPVMFEFQVTGLAKAYNYGQAVFLGNRQQDAALIATANEDRTATIAMVAKYLQLPVATQISNFENKVYNAAYYKPSANMEAALNALSNSEALQNIFGSLTLQKIQSNIQQKFAAQNWQVQYFQIDQILTVNGPGGNIPSTYTFIDGASWLVVLVPLPNATPLQFESSTTSSTTSTRYGGPILDAVIIGMVIVGTIIVIIAFQNLVVVIKNAAIAAANAMTKNAPAVVETVAVSGAIVVGVVLGIMLLIYSFKKKSTTNQASTGGT